MGNNDDPKEPESKPQPFIIDNQSPYFLHPLDSPGAIITTIKFNGRNYDLWEQAIRIALKVKNKLAFIEGTIPKPENKNGDQSMEANAWIWSIL